FAATTSSETALTWVDQLVELDQPVPPPADGQQPYRRRARRPRDRGELALPRLIERQRPAPAGEPRAARVRIEPGRAEQRAAIRLMVASVEEHVAERVANLARSLEDALVIAVGEHVAAPAEQSVHALRDPRLHAAHAARQ